LKPRARIHAQYVYTPIASGFPTFDRVNPKIVASDSMQLASISAARGNYRPFLPASTLMVRAHSTASSSLACGTSQLAFLTLVIFVAVLVLASHVPAPDNCGEEYLPLRIRAGLTVHTRIAALACKVSHSKYWFGENMRLFWSDCYSRARSELDSKLTAKPLWIQKVDGASLCCLYSILTSFQPTLNFLQRCYRLQGISHRAPTCLFPHQHF